MTIDVILILITLVVAVIGTTLDKPSNRVKGFLIFLALGASAGSIAKAYEDSKEKDFLKTAITSNLVPSGKVYGILAGQVADEVRERLKLTVANCYHGTDDGITCFFTSKTTPPTRATVVLSRPDVSDLYANYIQHRSNKKTVDKILNQEYKPSELEEDFEEKAAILGSTVLYRHLHVWPNSSYDDNGGQYLKKIYTGAGVSVVIQLSPVELAGINQNAEPKLFYEVEQDIRRKLSDQGIQTASDESAELQH
jgi:hypothetical protein